MGCGNCGSLDQSRTTMWKAPLTDPRFSEPPFWKGPENGCRAKNVEKCRKDFWHFLTIFAFFFFCPARKIFRKRAEYCFESTVSEERTHWVLGQTRWVLGKTRWVRVYTQIIGWKELTEFAPRNSVSPKKLTEFGVWNRTPRNRIRPVSEFWKVSKIFLTLFGDFWRFLTWPLSAGPFCGLLRFLGDTHSDNARKTPNSIWSSFPWCF